MERHTFRLLVLVLGMIGLFVLLSTFAPVYAQSDRGSNPGRPGSINYVEGQVSIGNKAIDPKSVGSDELEAGQSITTGLGKAEILLTPGSFLRLGDYTSMKMISSGLANTQIELQKGRAIVEVTKVDSENNLHFDLNGATIRPLKKGLYDLDMDRNQLRVFDGKAIVQENGIQVEVNEGSELNLNSHDLLKPEKFNRKTFQDDLYSWSSQRSDYLAEANSDAAQSYVGGRNSWLGAGWYWNPWFNAYTFIPGSGILYSPFGYGFYSPGFVFLSPFITFGHFHHHFVHGFYDHGFHGYGVYHRGFYGRGFPDHGFHGGGGFRGGGFGGGGFHGGRGH